MLIIVYSLIPPCLALLGFVLAKEARLARVKAINNRLRHGGSIVL